MGHMKNIIIVLIILAILVLGGYFFYQNLDNGNRGVDLIEEETATSTEPVLSEGEVDSRLENGQTVLGQSADGHDILAYHYGTGETELLFVGGIHGGYSWNTVLVAYALMDHLSENSGVIPENVMVTVIPVLNPDGLSETVGSTGRFNQSAVPTSNSRLIAGRYNSNGVDLNRNFDCQWQARGTWRDTTVNGGNTVFSEPESQAMREYVGRFNPSAAVVWYSAAGGVFSSSCSDSVSSQTRIMTNTYAEASGYPAYEEFDFYEITGDMVNWLAKENIPAISVLLSDHQNIEWSKNRSGIEALLQYYAE